MTEYVAGHEGNRLRPLHSFSEVRYGKHNSRTFFGPVEFYSTI